MGQNWEQRDQLRHLDEVGSSWDEESPKNDNYVGGETNILG